MKKVVVGYRRFRLSLTALAVGATEAAFAQQKTLTVSSWGGAFQKAQKEAWFGIVEKELSVTIKEDTTSGLPTFAPRSPRASRRGI